MIEIRNLSKTFQTKEGSVEALKDINLTIEDGDIYGIIGMSGAGKSTLVRCMNRLEEPTSGEILYDGEDITKFKGKKLKDLRSSVTMIFQQFNLLAQRNCLKNVRFPLEIAGVKKQEANEKAAELLRTVGLGDKLKSYPAQLSGGQKQRVAIARALATNPKVLLCDEATSALDPQTTGQILTLLKDINRKMGITIVIITHQMSVVQAVCSHVAILSDGKIAEYGNVKDVFEHPRTRVARHLIRAASLELEEGSVLAEEKKELEEAK